MATNNQEDTFTLDDDDLLLDERESAGSAESGNDTNDSDNLDDLNLDDASEMGQPSSPMQTVSPTAEDEAARKRQMIGKIGAVVAGVVGLGVVGFIGYSNFIAPALAPVAAYPQETAGVVSAPAVVADPVQPQASAIAGALLEQQAAPVGETGGFDSGAEIKPADGTAAAWSAAPVDGQGQGGVPDMSQAGSAASEPGFAVTACEDTQPLRDEITALKHQLAQSERTVEMLQRAKPAQANSAHSSTRSQTRSVAPSKKVLADYSVRVAREGQAWIDVGDRQVTVVQVGDRLPNGAKVAKIDADSGRVLTTMGTILP